jgi:hypothetical protein
MSGVFPSDRAGGARAAEPGRRRGGFFSRPKPAAPCEDQEDQVRELLYARPAGPERTVRVVERTRPPVQTERIAERPAA